MPDSARAAEVCSHPGRRVQPKPGHVRGDRLEPWIERLVPLPRPFRPTKDAAAERGGKIQKVVAEVRYASLVHEHIQGAHGAHVAVIEPGGEHEQPAQVATMLVGHDIVGIVGTYAKDLVGTQELGSFAREPGRHGPEHPAGPLRHGPEEGIDVCVDQRARSARARHGLTRFVRHELPAFEANNVVLPDVITERVEHARRDHYRTSREPEAARRVELQQVQPAPSVGHADSGAHTVGLHHEHFPRPSDVGRIGVTGAAPQLLRRHPRRPVPVDEPGTVHHLTQRIDAAGWNHGAFRVSFPRQAERIRHCLEYCAE